MSSIDMNATPAAEQNHWWTSAIKLIWMPMIVIGVLRFGADNPTRTQSLAAALLILAGVAVNLWVERHIRINYLQNRQMVYKTSVIMRLYQIGFGLVGVVIFVQALV